MTQIPRPLAALALTASLCACASAPTRFYTVDPRPPQDTFANYVGPAYRIDAVHIPTALDRPELVHEVSGERLVVHDQDHWAAPLGELLRRALTQDLAARLPQGKIIYPDAPKPPGSGGVVVDILAVSSTIDGVAMDVSWTFLPASAAPTAGAQASPVRHQSARLTVKAQGPGINATPAEFSELVDRLAEAIKADLQTATKAAT